MGDLQQKDQEMLLLNRRGGGNGRDTMLGLSATVEQRLFAGARLVYWVIGAVVVATTTVLGAYYRADARISQTAAELEAQKAVVQRLESEKQSKDSADANQQRVLDKLESIEKNFNDLRDDVKEIRARIDRRH